MLEENQCSTCGELAKINSGPFHDRLSGLPNVFLHDIETAYCTHCDNTDIIMPYPIRIDNAIALAVLNSPYRLTGPQLTLLPSRAQKTITNSLSFCPKMRPSFGAGKPAKNQFPLLATASCACPLSHWMTI